MARDGGSNLKSEWLMTPCIHIYKESENWMILYMHVVTCHVVFYVHFFKDAINLSIVHFHQQNHTSTHTVTDDLLN